MEGGVRWMGRGGRKRAQCFCVSFPSAGGQAHATTLSLSILLLGLYFGLRTDQSHSDIFISSLYIRFLCPLLPIPDSTLLQYSPGSTPFLLLVFRPHPFPLIGLLGSTFSLLLVAWLHPFPLIGSLQISLPFAFRT